MPEEKKHEVTQQVTQTEQPKEVDREKELEEQIAALQKEKDELKAKETKTKGWFKSMLERGIAGKTDPAPEPEETDPVKKELKQLRDEKKALEERVAAQEEMAHNMQLAAFCKEQGIPAEHQGYFTYLLDKAQDKKGDEELDDKEITAIIEEVKALTPVAKAQQDPAKPFPPEKSKQTGLRINKDGAVSLNKTETQLKQFKNYGTGKRGVLAKENPELYNRLVKEEWEENGWKTLGENERIHIGVE